jgi:hypothetical protein
MEIKINKDTQITVQQAYKAMFMLIDVYYQEGWPTYDIRDLLSEMQIVLCNDEDGFGSADPAIWDDWKKHIKAIIDEKNDDNRDLSKPYFLHIITKDKSYDA